MGLRQFHWKLSRTDRDARARVRQDDKKGFRTREFVIVTQSVGSCGGTRRKS